MSPTSPYRPRVARETRLLLATALLSTAALWTLARVQPATLTTPASPVPLLTPFALEAPYARLAADVARVQSRLEASLLVIEARDSAMPVGPGRMNRLTGLRLGGDRVLTVQPSGRRLDLGEALTAVGHDPASGLTLVSAAPASVAGSPVPWPGQSPGSPRYLVATDATGISLGLRPVFVGGFEEVSGPLGSRLWRPRSRLDLPFGTILFTLAGELAGVVLNDDSSVVVLPGPAVLDSASKLETAGLGVVGRLGLEVQSLTPSLSIATGSANGVVVTWVESGSPASAGLAVGDVIESWDSQPLGTTRDWDVRVARLRSGDTVRLGVHSPTGGRELSLVAVPRSGAAPASTPEPAPATSLGMTMRRLDGAGTAVTRVAAGSAAFRAGLEPGDIVTRIGTIAAPTPQQVTRAFAGARVGEPLLVAVTRAERHLVTTLGK